MQTFQQRSHREEAVSHSFSASPIGIPDGAPVIRKKKDRVLTGRQPWELRSCELVFASVNVLEKERVVPRPVPKLGCAFYLFIRAHQT